MMISMASYPSYPSDYNDFNFNAETMTYNCITREQLELLVQQRLAQNQASMNRASMPRTYISGVSYQGTMFGGGGGGAGVTQSPARVLEMNEVEWRVYGVQKGYLTRFKDEVIAGTKVTQPSDKVHLAPWSLKK